jgi:hypothetical protein
MDFSGQGSFNMNSHDLIQAQVHLGPQSSRHIN